MKGHTMNHTDYMTGAELQCLREACGLDRDQLGEMCGGQGRSIKYWEMGQSNHGVPADVAALVLELEAKVRNEAMEAIDRLSSASDVVLMRTADPLKNAVASRVFVNLHSRGIPVRMVSFDYKAYRAQLSGQDTPEARQEWARRALKEQARPHKQDQPV